MKQYHDLIQHVLDNGIKKEDRTGTGTLSVFGYQMRFDLQKGFPLVTTKKVDYEKVLGELLWFLSGSTNANECADKYGFKVWRKWADEDGELGPVYGWNWRNWGKKPEAIPKVKPKLQKGVKATYLGIANGSGKEGHFLKKTWEGMIARCYDPNSISYPLYGAKGVRVVDRWLYFENFKHDAMKLIGYKSKEENPRDYVLDKDIKGNGFVYGPKTCMFVTPSKNTAATHKKVYVLEKDGHEFTVTNITKFAEEQGFNSANLSDLWTGNKNAKVRFGFTLKEVIDLDKGIDQIKEVINQIKKILITGD